MPVRPLLPLLLLLGVSLPAVAAPPARPAATGLAVTVTRPEPAELPRRLAATGSLEAWQEIIIAPEVGGYQVAAVEVEIGDPVRKGQLLARLAPELLQAQVAIGRAAVRQAEAALDNARAALRRGQALAPTGGLSAADLDQLQSNAIAAEAALATAQANLGAAELRLRMTRLTAPDDGIITARSANLGQVVAAGSEMLRLLRRGRIEWRAEVPEADLAQIRPGQRVQLVTAAGAALAGTVRSVAPTVRSSDRTGLVYVDVDQPAGATARPGMYARGTIETGRGAGLLVPLASVVMRDGYSYVFVVRDGQGVERRRVQTGALHDGRIEVSAGLAAAERIVERGAGFLSDGAAIRITAQP